MNKPLIITVAIVLFLLALGSWGYLFFFGAPQTPDDIFSDLGIGLGTQSDIPNQIENQDDQAKLDITGSPLQQLTLRPVAGFVSTNNATVRYAEQGTGHLYEIDLASGNETRISNTTLPQIQEAIFSPDGNSVVLQTYGQNISTVLGTLVEGSLSTQNLPPKAENVAFISNSTIVYSLSANGETTGYQYNADTKEQVITYVVPFSSVRAHYTPGQTYVSNRHAPELEGSLWAVSGRSFTQVSINEFGFVAELGADWYSIAFTEADTYQSRSINIDTNTMTQLPVSFIPEKCDWGGRNTLWCAAPFSPVPHTYLKDWYQGKIRANDALWVINPATETAELLVSPTDEIGRQLDMTNVTRAESGALFFVNRQDNTLWLYDQ